MQFKLIKKQSVKKTKSTKQNIKLFSAATLLIRYNLYHKYKYEIIIIVTITTLMIMTFRGRPKIDMVRLNVRRTVQAHPPPPSP